MAHPQYGGGRPGFHFRDSETDCYWWQGTRDAKPAAADIAVELAEGPTTFPYGDGTITFVKLAKPVQYREMCDALSPTGIGRVRVYPVRDPENSHTGQVLLPGCRHRIFEVLKDVARLGVVKNVQEGEDDRAKGRSAGGNPANDPRGRYTPQAFRRPRDL